MIKPIVLNNMKISEYLIVSFAIFLSILTGNAYSQSLSFKGLELGTVMKGCPKGTIEIAFRLFKEQLSCRFLDNQTVAGRNVGQMTLDIVDEKVVSINANTKSPDDYDHITGALEAKYGSPTEPHFMSGMYTLWRIGPWTIAAMPGMGTITFSDSGATLHRLRARNAALSKDDL
ncbi:hypothetical protein [Polaromonas glacialis]|uniref:hypothetical protein n=1 Tax=Polaromonas glacialis TaxID=866564 RepID=UPI0012EBE205|nr:hypothetical protein [Polaromonas glacialis]